MSGSDEDEIAKYLAQKGAATSPTSFFYPICAFRRTSVACPAAASCMV
jgi:hypothetical protein